MCRRSREAWVWRHCERASTTTRRKPSVIQSLRGRTADLQNGCGPGAIRNSHSMTRDQTRGTGEAARVPAPTDARLSRGLRLPRGERTGFRSGSVGPDMCARTPRNRADETGTILGHQLWHTTCPSAVMPMTTTWMAGVLTGATLICSAHPSAVQDQAKTEATELARTSQAALQQLYASVPLAKRLGPKAPC